MLDFEVGGRTCTLKLGDPAARPYASYAYHLPEDFGSALAAAFREVGSCSCRFAPRVHSDPILPPRSLARCVRLCSTAFDCVRLRRIYIQDVENRGGETGGRDRGESSAACPGRRLSSLRSHLRVCGRMSHHHHHHTIITITRIRIRTSERSQSDNPSQHRAAMRATRCAPPVAASRYRGGANAGSDSNSDSMDDVDSTRRDSTRLDG